MDKKLIVEELKKEGLDLAEDTAVNAVKSVFRILDKLAESTPSLLMVVGMLNLAKPVIFEALDKIDGKEG